MATPIEIIYCAASNKTFAQIAIDAGFTYGARLPATVYFPPEFVDNDYKKPAKEKYVKEVAKVKPRLATVLDWQTRDQLPEVLTWAEEIAPYVQEVLIVPKLVRTIALIPNSIGGKPIRLAYSVPTSYGGTPVPTQEFGNRPVHLLGGSPNIQRKLNKYLNVVSLDGNYHQLMANHNQFFVHTGLARYARNRFWPTLLEADGKKWGDGSKTANAPYEAFSRSCEAIMELWEDCR